MKKIFILLLVIFSYSKSVKSSHVVGGEITWKCLSSGDYVFYLKIYKDCDSINYDYQSDQVLNISGSLLPTNGITSIVVSPDSMRWMANNNGEISIDCSSPNASPYSCSTGELGMMQEFYYVSNPIKLTGVPPIQGWQFSWLSTNYRSKNFENYNVIDSSRIVLRAIMYSGPNGEPSFPCFDSSPEFKASPASIICRDYLFTHNYNVVDEDFDSLGYRWDRAYYVSLNDTVFTGVSFKFPQYNTFHPTPGPSQNRDNVSAAINSISGDIVAAIYSGSSPKRYLMVTKVDAYRKSHRGVSKKISSTFREVPLTVIDCNSLPNGRLNRRPRFGTYYFAIKQYFSEVIAGQLISIPIEVVEYDFSDVGQQLQTLTMIPDGVLFSNSKSLPDRSSSGITPCPIPDMEPCAYLRNASPILDTSLTPSVPSIKSNFGGLYTEFVWQTNCDHLKSRDSLVKENSRVFNFLLKVYDDHCPVPLTSTENLSIVVKRSEPLLPPTILGVSVNLDGSISYNWIPPMDTVFSFSHYIVQAAKTPENNPIVFWSPLEDSLKKYQTFENTNQFRVLDYNNPQDSTSGIDLLSPYGDKMQTPHNFYMRMRAISGCVNKDTALWSTEARIIELTASPAKAVNARDRVNLSWNETRSISPLLAPNVVYQSLRKYNIYANDSVFNGGLNDSSNWSWLGETYDTSYTVVKGNCGQFSAFRVEAVDTVIFYQQGSGKVNEFWGPKLDTMVYSTFSFIDTMMIGEAIPQVISVNREYLTSSIQRQTYQWFDCESGMALQGETSKTYVPQKAGRYRVIAANDNCPTSSSDCFEVTPLNNQILVAYLDSIYSADSTTNYQWNKGCSNTLTPIIGEDQRSFMPTRPGEYSLTVSKHGFSETSDCFTLDTLNTSVQIFENDSLKSLEEEARYLWVNCKDFRRVPNGNLQGVSILDTGRFAVILSAYGYNVISECIPMYAVGLNESNFPKSIRFFPNPTSGSVNIQLEKTYQKIDIQVRNLQGQLVQEKQFANQKNVEVVIEAKAGVYFVELRNEKGERAYLKVVKE